MATPPALSAAKSGGVQVARGCDQRRRARSRSLSLGRAARGRRHFARRPIAMSLGRWDPNASRADD